MKFVRTGGYASTSTFEFWLLLWVRCVFGSILYIFVLNIFFFPFLLSVDGELVDGVGHKQREPFKLCPSLLFVNVKHVFVTGCYIYLWGWAYIKKASQSV